MNSRTTETGGRVKTSSGQLTRVSIKSILIWVSLCFRYDRNVRGDGDFAEQININSRIRS